MLFNPNQCRKTIIANCFLYILLYLTGEILSEAESFSLQPLIHVLQRRN